MSPESAARLACPRCRTILPPEACHGSQLIPCPGCDRAVHVDVFPALFRPRQKGRPAEALVETGVSSCFYHENKKAVVPCDSCGRFLCALCDVELNGRHLCPNCLQNPAGNPTAAHLEKSRAVPDTAALSLAIFPMIIFPLTVLTAPAALFYALLSFRRPSSIVPRTRARAYVAIVLSLGQLLGWAAFLLTTLR